MRGEAIRNTPKRPTGAGHVGRVRCCSGEIADVGATLKVLGHSGRSARQKALRSATSLARFVDLRNITSLSARPMFPSGFTSIRAGSMQGTRQRTRRTGPSSSRRRDTQRYLRRLPPIRRVVVRFNSANGAVWRHFQQFQRLTLAETFSMAVLADQRQPVSARKSRFQGRKQRNFAKFSTRCQDRTPKVK